MAESRMELFIETLTGTAFELSCSPLETIVSIKAKIQYSEGIPVSQQHLIWKSQELNDDLCLQDYCINDGATLKLVLGMRGGPINTRQVSDTRKLKDLAEYVERNSETAGSSGRPFTVLVFHDGDKVHMYTLMERGECAVSPLSGTISETSSVASIKNVEELDQDLARENEVTREKLAQLQEQLRALNINRPKKLPATTAHPKHTTVQEPSTVAAHQEAFHLPPLQRIDAFNSQTKQYSHKNAQTKIFKSNLASSSTQATNGKGKMSTEDRILPASPISKAPSLDYLSSNLSTFVLEEDKDTSGPACSNFLPYIATSQGATRQRVNKGLHKIRQRPPQRQVLAINMSPPCLDSIVKYDPSSMKKGPSLAQKLPVTSNPALSSRKLIDLEDWLQTRPKTSPVKTKESVKRSIKSPLSVGISSEVKSNLMMQMLSDDQNDSFNLSLGASMEEKDGQCEEIGLQSTVASDAKTLNHFSPHDSKGSDVYSSSAKLSPKPNEDATRPFSAKKLPLIKTKKKSHKRCSLCSKKTGLATSYTCRCGKNFCATHRYAEVHHCSYDYKTEGRRLLQLNNPVVTASKLPKI